MWHFAISVFLIELYGRNLLLTAVFGLVVAGSVLLLGALIGDWVDRNPRNKVAHASLFIQNISVTVCSIVLMLVFSYKQRIEQIWDGWLTVVCYTVVIILADVANLASTALTIAIQRDWIVVITGYNRGHLAGEDCIPGWGHGSWWSGSLTSVSLIRTKGMNATMRRIDQVTNILAPLAVGQVMTLASNVVGCGFILGWNLVSLIVEFFFLSRVYRIVPALSVKPPAVEVDQVYLQRMERRHSVEENVEQPQPLTEGNCHASLHLKEITNLPLCFRKFRWLVSTCKDGWRAYYRQPVFLAGMGLAFLYTTVLGFDCITTGYAYTQGISGSLLSLLMGVSAITGLMGTVMFTRLRKTYGLVNTGIISSCLHLGCLLLCVCSVFAPGSPMDLSLLMPYITFNSSVEFGGMASQRQKHTNPLRGGSNQPLLPDRSSIHWTNNTVLFDNVPSGTAPESYISIILLFLGVITARIGERTKSTYVLTCMKYLAFVLTGRLCCRPLVLRPDRDPASAGEHLRVGEGRGQRCAKLHELPDGPAPLHHGDLRSAAAALRHPGHHLGPVHHHRTHHVLPVRAQSQEKTPPRHIRSERGPHLQA
ncbi:solute carrier family 40 member 1 isoform X1 [Betta splendens]|uniref:Solute carrier family 40 member n=1 Tax=Betta splendens TaxID=158456 RepID=A0A9W2XAM7_BETSP|nr:solute carrier family 40 member 1 isoform X1 [Betta splendens]